MKNTIKAFKAFDKNMQCRGFQYKEGETYTIEGDPILCEHGFHFCKDLVLTLAYYPDEDINDNFYAEVEIIGDVVFEEPTSHKGATNKIKILRVIPCEEVSSMVDDKSNSGNSNSGSRNSGSRNSGSRNSGNSNSGNSNSGSRNSGNSNSGYRNSGNSNSGYSNSGCWNSCNYESGMFNSKQSETIRVFNSECLKCDWDKSYKPDFLYFNIDQEIGYKESFIKSWDDADKYDRDKVKDLPNFNAEAFYEISGIDLRE